MHTHTRTRTRTHTHHGWQIPTYYTHAHMHTHTRTHAHTHTRTHAHTHTHKYHFHGLSLVADRQRREQLREACQGINARSTVLCTFFFLNKFCLKILFFKSQYPSAPIHHITTNLPHTSIRVLVSLTYVCIYMYVYIYICIYVSVSLTSNAVHTF
jgi:hypothetical protein